MKASAEAPLLTQERPIARHGSASKQDLFEECDFVEGDILSWRRHIWQLLNPSPDSPASHRRYQFLSAIFTVLIILQDVHVTTGDIASFSTWPKMLVIDGPAVLFFGLEYLGRVWSCPESRKLRAARPGKSDCSLRLGYVLSFMPIVDLLVLLALGADIYIAAKSGHVKDEGQGFLRAFRMFRMFRVMMLFRFEHSTNALMLVFAVVMRKKHELWAALLTAFLLMLTSAIVMFHLEKGAAPDDESAITDVSSAVWWAAAALTTVGYGDVTPKTVPGRMLGVVIAFFGIGIFGLPAGIISAGFSEEVAMNNAKEDEQADGSITNDVRSLADKVDKLSVAVDKMQRDQDRMLAMQQQLLEALKK